MELADLSNLVPKNGTIALLGDIHEGLVSRSDSIYDAIDRCKEKKSRVLLMGDLIEARQVHHPFYSLENSEGKYATVMAQADGLVEMLKPIKKNIIGVMDGNHEMNQGVAEVLPVSKYIADKLGLDVPSGCYTIKAKIGEDNLYATHGYGQVNSKAGDADQRYNNDVRALRRKLRGLAGDCMVMAMGHIHKLRVGHPVRELAIMGIDKQKAVYTNPEMYRDTVIPETQRWYCSTGSFIRGYMEGITTYVERGMYYPTELGYIEIQMKNGRVAEVREVIL